MSGLDLRNYKNQHPWGDKVVRMLWKMVYGLMFWWTPDRIRAFNAWRIFLLRCFGAKIGRHCAIKSSCEIWLPGNLQIGDYVALSEHVVCYCVDKVLIGSQTTISRDSFLCCAGHDVASPIMELTVAPITIGANAWVAARAIILPGRKVGDGAVVAAGAVVVNDVEPWTVVGGNPARFIKQRVLKDQSNGE